MWLGNAVTSSTLHADPPSNETINVFYINIFRVIKSKKNVMSEARSTNRGKDRRIQGFVGET